MTEDITREGRVRNCPWGYKCEKTWDDLQPSSDRSIRFCDACDQNVYLCETQKDLSLSILSNRCVAFHPKLIKAIETRNPHREKVDIQLHGKNVEVEARDPEEFMVIGQVEAEYYRPDRQVDSGYKQMKTRLLGDSTPHSFTFLFGDTGDLHLEVDFPGDYDREFVITVDATHVPELMAAMDANLDPKNKEAMGKVTGMLRSKFRNIDAFTSWLKKHGIAWASWAWPG